MPKLRDERPSPKLNMSNSLRSVEFNLKKVKPNPISSDLIFVLTDEGKMSFGPTFEGHFRQKKHSCPRYWVHNSHGPSHQPYL